MHPRDRGAGAAPAGARLEGAGIARDGARWLAQVEDATVRALATRGEAAAVELSADVPALRERVLMAEGKSYEGWQNITTWVLFQLRPTAGSCAAGRAAPGSAASTSGRRPTSGCPEGHEHGRAERAEEELVRRWLAAFGPGTMTDLRWWTGWTMGRT